ncbi:unannotated protein [freshwater metagenome]|uniref:Unannotated protein n=1 Tax=freshwater metagenome TaxID=449393 RepID=A0A6J7KAM8_9ZZZZ|nr:hypothetical protein [Actinomycetota bacterium]
MLRPSSSAHRPARSPRRARPGRPLLAVVGLGVLAAAAASVPGSGAAFSSRTTNPANALTAAADWVAPTVAVTDPGTYLSGAPTIRATASDSGSGVRSVALQIAPNAGAETSYVALCTATVAPYGCTWDTTRVADGSYKLRAIATDRDGNAATSAVVSQRIVDNTAPTAALNDPGQNLQPGPVTLSATASDATSGVRQVVLQRASSATGPWTDVCTQTTAPYSCTWTATAGTHLLRAVVTDVAGNVTTTAAITRIVKDTVRPTGAAISTTNGNATAGSVGPGDTLTLRWSEPMLLGSILTGLNTTTTTPLTVRFTNPSFGLGSGDDTISFLAANGGATPNLGTVGLGSSNWLRAFAGAPTYAATAIARTVDGATEVQITLGTRTGTTTPAYATPVALSWTPSTVPQDLGENTTDAAPVTQPSAGVAF